MTNQNLNHLLKEQAMKAIKFASIAALLLTASAAQATVSPTTAVDVLWQWLFPTEAQPELKHCPRFPRCDNVLAPEPTTDK